MSRRNSHYFSPYKKKDLLPGFCLREPHPYASYLHVSRTLGSGQAHPHHPKEVAYRCYLPILAEFTDFRRAEPIHQCFQNWPLQPRIHRTRPEIGKGGIRTRDRVTPIHALQACALNQTQPPFHTDFSKPVKKSAPKRTRTSGHQIRNLMLYPN